MSDASHLELAALGERASGCVDCGLSETRTQVVFGDGRPDADVVFVGEAPGFHEDQQGIPFVGAAGKLLDRLLGEIGLRRDEVYIANVLKCRPPGNRDPLTEEVDACKGYLRSQLMLIDPLVVVTLGNTATKLLLKRDVGITRLRGQVYPWWNRHLIPTFHPAAALRGGEKVLADMRIDFGLIGEVLAAGGADAGDAEEEAAEQMELFS